MSNSHLDLTAMEKFLADSSADVDSRRATFVFYDFETSRPESHDVTHIAAVSDMGPEFKEMVLSPFKRNTGSFLPRHPKFLLWDILMKPREAFSAFVEWSGDTTTGSMARTARSATWSWWRTTGPATTTCSSWSRRCKRYSIRLPNFRLADSVLISKVLLGPRTDCKLITLVAKHLPTFSTSRMTPALTPWLFKVVQRMNPYWRDLPWALGTPLYEHARRVGFSTKGIVR